tara:strand:+ start:3506 stop:4348 length:843 start_codon:yes stop_codon:yes gene_type:complete
MKNIDEKTVKSFGDEWTRFDQSALSSVESSKIFQDYFSIFPWDELPLDCEGFDMGCGSGRWAKLVAPKVKHLNCVDPSSAIDVARVTLIDHKNISYHHSSLDDAPIKKASQDFGYSLGVLHHIPDTSQAIQSCTNLLKPGAPLLLYLYYAFDDRPMWYRFLWRLTDYTRKIIFHMPPTIKNIITNAIALFIYWPLARLAGLFSYLGVSTKNMPLEYYQDCSFYTMQTDSRDRFGTPLEQRFSKIQIKNMMIDAGLENISFSKSAPFWCVIGYAAQSNDAI